jgi:hypothetical protein
LRLQPTTAFSNCSSIAAVSPFAPATLPASQYAETASVSATGNSGLLSFFASSRRNSVESEVFAFRSSDVLPRSEREAACEVPQCAVYKKVVCLRRLRNGEGFVPPTEANERQPWQVAEAWRFKGLRWAAIIVDCVRSGLVRSAKGIFAATFKQLRPPKEVKVVRVIHARIEA